MFRLGEMFVSFIGKDSGLMALMKKAETGGRLLEKAYSNTLKTLTKVGTAGLKTFDRIGAASIKASSDVVKSFEKITVAGIKAFSKLAPVAEKFFSKLSANASKMGVAGIKSFTTLANTGLKQLGGTTNAAFKGIGSGAGKLAGSIAGAASSVVGSFSIIGAASTALWAGMTAGLGALVGLLAGGAGLGALVNMASNFQEASGKFDQSFGDSAAHAREELNKLAEAQGRSKAAMQDSAAGVQSLLVPLGFAREKAAEMSVSMAQLAVDMASFHNVSDKDAIDDISAALTGSGETMKKYGVVINEATMKAELARLGFQGTADAASEELKTLARLNLIIQGTRDAHGDAVKTGGGFANQMKRILAIISDLGIKLGQVFLPAAEVFAGFFSDTLSMISENSGGLESWTATFTGLAENAVQWLNRIITLFMNWGEISGQASNVVAAAFRESFTIVDQLFGNLEALIVSFGENLWSFFPNLFESIAAAHGSLWDFMKKGWGEIWDFIASGGQDSIDLNLEKMLAEMKSRVKAPDFQPVGTSEALQEWGRLISVIDAKMENAKKKSESLRQLGTFGASAAGISTGGGAVAKVKLEMVNAADLFKNTLSDVFDENGEKQKLEWAKRGALASEAGTAAAKETVAVMRKIGSDISQPVVA